MSEQQPKKKPYPPVPREVRNPLFAERLKDHKVPAWPYKPAFDRLLLFQIETVESDTAIEGGRIIAPDQAKTRDRVTAPRGLLLDAGMGALDHLMSHDIMIGDVVWFARHSNYAVDISVGGGRFVKLCFLRSSELLGSEDAIGRMRDGATEYGTDDEGRWCIRGRKRVDLDPSSEAM